MVYDFGFFNNKNDRDISIFIFYDMILISFFFFFFFLAPTNSMAELETGQFFELFSRDELAKIAGYGEEKLSTVLVTGSVHCETSLRESQSHAWPVSGASVAVSCRLDEKKGRSEWTKGATDENGDFTIDLPSELHAIGDLDRKCCVKLLRIPKNSLCKPASVNRHKGLRLSSVENGVRTYSSGTVKLQHLAAKRSRNS